MNFFQSRGICLLRVEENYILIKYQNPYKMFFFQLKEQEFFIFKNRNWIKSNLVESL